MLDQHKAERLVAIGWKEGYFDEGMTLQEIFELVKTGFDECSDTENCDSRILSGNACKCIRQRFPTPEHYSFYLEIRGYYTKKQTERLLQATLAGQKRNNDVYKN